MESAKETCPYFSLPIVSCDFVCSLFRILLEAGSTFLFSLYMNSIDVWHQTSRFDCACDPLALEQLTRHL